jgi:hypothetical protein
LARQCEGDQSSPEQRGGMKATDRLGDDGILGGAVGAARWSSQAWPRRARLRHQLMEQRGWLREARRSGTRLVVEKTIELEAALRLGWRRRLGVGSSGSGDWRMDRVEVA